MRRPSSPIRETIARVALASASRASRTAATARSWLSRKALRMASSAIASSPTERGLRVSVVGIRDGIHSRVILDWYHTFWPLDKASREVDTADNDRNCPEYRLSQSEYATSERLAPFSIWL